MKLKSATFLIVLATLIWGGTPAIMKLTLLEVPPFTLAFIRMFFASLIFLPLVYKKLKVDKADYYQLFLAAFTGVTLNIAFFFLGLKLAPAITAALLVAAVPVMTLAASHIYLKEKITPQLLVASILALSGIVIMVGLPGAQNTLLSLLGNLLLLLSALAWVVNEIIAKKLFKKYSGTVVAFYTIAIGAITFIPFALLEQLTYPTWYKNVTLSGFLGILYGIFFASLVAYWAWQTGLAKMPAGRASFFFYLDPISGAILAMLLLGEKLTTTLVIGSILIMLGVLAIEIKRKPHPLHTKYLK